jgi:hypothetical protein
MRETKTRIRSGSGGVVMSASDLWRWPADLVRDSLHSMLEVQAISEMEQGATGVPVSV